MAAPVEAAIPAAVPVWTEPVGALLGSGGFASVWELPRRGDGEPARVLKVAHADHDLARARLAREAEALAAIHARHPGAVPRLDGHGVLADGRAWLAMERITGTCVTELTLAGAVRPDRAVSITLALLDALAHVHAAGFVHRDLKPDNLYRRDDGTIVILDLGLARKLPTDPDDPTRANVQVGSLEYAPPEQLVDAASVDVRADLYAVGCILFELCAGRPPFVGDAAALERAHAALRPPRLGALAAVPVALEIVCQDCLAKDPAKRPHDVEDLRRRIRATRDTPTMMRTAPAISQITESKQPVVVLWIELPKVDRAVLGLLAARRVIIASQRGRRIVGALLGSEHGDPATTALSLARDLVAGGARVAVHLDALQLEPTAAGPTVHGEAVERAESWLPTSPWTGIVLTRAIAAVAQVPTRPLDDAGPGFRALAEAGAAAELFGRDALLTDLAADAAAALRGVPPAEQRSVSGLWAPTGPAFALLSGDAGTGKTVLATELGRRVAELGARVFLAVVPPPGSGKPPPLAALIGEPPGPAVRAVGDALRAAARAQPLVVILDDLHLADHDLLDALEYATLGGEALPLWVLGVASPRLLSRRPNLGARAERHRHDVLGPLDEDAAVQLTAWLLRPAEYPPLRALRQLVTLAHGNPLHLTMLAREIHERGAIKRRPGGEAFLDTSALNELEPIALGPWLAARELAGLAPELVALARVCAVLGGPLARDELAAVIESVEGAGGATTLIDVDVGLRELCAAGILERASTGYAARQPLIEEGLYATTDAEVRRAIHTAALAFWSGATPDDREVAARVARHAEAAGEVGAAAVAFTTLGKIAEREYRVLDAESAWTGALRHLQVADVGRARALLGLARAHLRLQRMVDARRALEDAIEITRAIGEPELEIELLLELGIVLDFSEDFEAARAVVELARARLGTAAHDAHGLSSDVDLAVGRALFREQKFVEAAEKLREVYRLARSTGRASTSTVAALLLGPALADLGELDEAEGVFAELISDCMSRGDRFHLAVAYANRAWLWSARGAIERTTEDLRLASQLARESGQATVERSVTHNLAEQLLWEDQLDEALRLARRSLALQSRASEGGTALDRLLLARVLAARDELPELVLVLSSLGAGERAGDDDAASTKTIESLRAFADRAGPDVWREVLAGTDALFLQLRLEIWHLAARCGGLPAELRTTAAELALGDAMWRRRAAEF